jgi:hypothetical protein
MISTGKLLEKSRILEKVFYNGANGVITLVGHTRPGMYFEFLVKH